MDSLAHTLPDTVFARRVRQSFATRMPDSTEPVAPREPMYHVVGAVKAHDTLAYVVLVRTLKQPLGPVPELFRDHPRETQQTEVMVLRRHGREWRSMLDPVSHSYGEVAPADTKNETVPVPRPHPVRRLPDPRPATSPRPGHRRRTGHLRARPANAITDVAGVRVGQATVVAGRLGAHRRHGDPAARRQPYRERVPAAIHVGNGFGKLLGVTQVPELGELETPILLTCTLCVWRAADAMVGWLLAQPGMEHVRSINPVVGETNDGGLNAIRSAADQRRATCAPRWTGARERAGRRGERRRGHRHRRVRLEGRHRHLVPRAAGGARLDRSACSCRATSAASCR